MPGAPLSLYIHLEPGRIAELDAVARVSLQLSAAVREIAFFVDPIPGFRIELERERARRKFAA